MLGRFLSCAVQAGFATAEAGDLDRCESVGLLLMQLTPSDPQQEQWKAVLLPDANPVSVPARYLLRELQRRLALRFRAAGQVGAVRIALASRMIPLVKTLPHLETVLGTNHVTDANLRKLAP